jgi:arsenate reductase
MTQITLYHNPRCSKSREALAILQAKGIEPELRLYLESVPTIAELKAVLAKLGIGARDLLRTGEAAYKAGNLADPDLSDAQLLAAMVAEPKLIQRPIAIAGKRAVIGRPPETVLELLP